MKTVDIPKTDSNIEYFINQCQRDDVKSELAEMLHKDEQTETIPHGVGRCLLTPLDKNAPILEIPVYVNDQMFRKYGYTDWNTVANGMAISIEGYDGFYIFINAVAYQLYLNTATRGIAIGIIAHEMGHILAGDCDPSRPENTLNLLPKEEYATGDYRYTVLHLLQGGSIVDDKEHRATQYAIGLVGVAPLLATSAYFSSQCRHIMNRMEFSNQLDQIICQLGPTYTPPELDYKDLDVRLYTAEEIKVIITKAANQINKD